MTDAHALYRYSITIETHDEAVLHCLRALCEFSELRPDARIGTEEANIAAWRRADDRVTFRFSDPRHRGVFLGEATRLLAGKWTRVAQSDDDPATPPALPSSPSSSPHQSPRRTPREYAASTEQPTPPNQTDAPSQ